MGPLDHMQNVGSIHKKTYRHVDPSTDLEKLFII